VQSGLLLFGLGALAVAVLWGGTEIPSVPEAGAPSPTTGPGPSWLDTVENWAIPICGSVVAQEVLSRSLAARSARVARNAALIGGGVYLLVGLVPLTIGALGAQLAPGLADPEGILPHLARQHLPPALNLVFAGALIAAILSTVDSCLLVVSSLVTRNLAPRRGSERTHLRVARCSVMAGGLVSYVLARSHWNVRDLVEEASGFGSAGIFVLACTGLFSRRGGAIAANLTLAAGLGTWITARYALPDASGPLAHPYLASLGAAALAFVLGAGAERLRSATARGQRGDPPGPGVDQ
jgi:Na+/proline symporter